MQRFCHARNSTPETAPAYLNAHPIKAAQGLINIVNATAGWQVKKLSTPGFAAQQVSK